MFNQKGFSIRIEPLHPDGCCGLGNIGAVAMKLNMISFLIGIYLSLKVIDKVIVQGRSLGADIGNPIMLGGYAILAPLLFFFPLAAAHDRMKKGIPVWPFDFKSIGAFMGTVAVPILPVLLPFIIQFFVGR
ncbi:MAG: hypothetical protein ACE5JS_02360 [Nitrospinota bacterium]